jgi:catalase-peroxidase
MLRQTIPLLAAFAVTMSPMVISDPAVVQSEPKSNQFWWPQQLDLSPLRDHDAASSPMGEDFNYAEAFRSLDLNGVKKDIQTLMKTSQDWWPAD